MRAITFEKFDNCCADMLENIEKIIYLTEEEMQKLKESKTGTQKNQDSNIKQQFFEIEPRDDIKLGLYGKCINKSLAHPDIHF